ncbi:MAG: site-2 protease family protein [Acidobacteriota bacterium]
MAPTTTARARAASVPRARGTLIPALLFAATFATTTLCGMAWASGALDPLQELALLFGIAGGQLPLAVVGEGLAYAIALLGFFLAHEMGHYLTCRRYGLAASLPHFIPVPFGFGTFGAVIRIRSPFPDRRTLFDVGIAGPLAGLPVALAAVVWGLVTADVAPAPGLSGGGIWFGDSLLTYGLQHLLRPDAAGGELLVGPVFIAGWLGLVATAINLSPAGQLDGGHVLFAVAPRWHRAASLASGLFFASLVVTRAAVWGRLSPWALWAVIVLVFCRRHPPVPDGRPLGATRRVLAVLALVLFVLIFVPAPLELIQ